MALVTNKTVICLQTNYQFVYKQNSDLFTNKIVICLQTNVQTDGAAVTTGRKIYKTGPSIMSPMAVGGRC
jgi:hypothetical protein